MKFLQDLLTLYLAPGIGPGGCKRLVEWFGSPEHALTAKRADLEKITGLRKQVIDSLHNALSFRDMAKKELDKARASGVSILHWRDDLYPARLKGIHNSPVLLYVKGNPACLNTPALAMVGSRAATSYGRSVASSLSSRLAEKGFTIISGMALGIDTAAHKGTIAAGGKTIAVLGCGLDIVYPAENRGLYDKITEQGAVVSEYPFGTAPDGFRFPARNRIISGMALGVVVVEATKKSGSLITAQLALEQGREVFAVPGRVDSVKSEGAHSLLKEGAKLVHCIDDILEEIHPGALTASIQKNLSGLGSPVAELINLSGEEKDLLAFLETYPKTIDEIIIKTGITAQKVNELLLMLELRNLIETLPGRQYRTIIDSSLPGL